MNVPAGVYVPPWEGRAAQAARRLVRAEGRAAGTPCCICGHPIDYDLVYPHPHSCSVQHIKARKHFPLLTWVPSNWGPAHLECNLSAGTGENASATDLGIVDDW